MGYLKRRLQAAGPTQWPEIVRATGVAKSLPRKIAYNDRINPGVQKVQPLIDYFQAIDAAAADGNEADAAPTPIGEAAHA